MKLGEAQMRVVEDHPIEIKDDDTKEVLRTIGRNVAQFDGPPMAWNAAGIPYATIRWIASGENATKRLLDAFEVFLTPVITDEDFWSIEWRVRPSIEHHDGHAHLYSRLIVHKRSRAFRDAGIIGVQEGYPSWPVPE